MYLFQNAFVFVKMGEADGATVIIEVQTADRFVLQAGHFLDRLTTGAVPVVTASDGARAIDILQAAYASARPDDPRRKGI